MNQPPFFLTAQGARTARDAMALEESSVSLSLDLGLTTSALEVRPGELRLPDSTTVSLDSVEYIAGFPGKVFRLNGGRPIPVEIAREHYFKLYPTHGAPTLEIDGIRMHRTQACDPFRDAEKKARSVVRRGHAVLDTCTGLGYTAIWASRLGASRVLSTEFDANVIEIARVNPWSREFFETDSIEFHHADIREYTAALAVEQFDSILHDPPRFSRAGELYGEQFYRELARVLRRGGRMFHYTGNPYSRYRKKRFLQGIARRLENAGFRASFAEELQGFIASRA